MYGHYMDVALFEKVGDVVRVDTSLDVCCEDSGGYTPSNIF